MNRGSNHIPKNVKPLWDAVGGLSMPSKMPGFSYSIPASLCKTGGKLAMVEGTVCSNCYALKGRYRFRNVKAAMLRRYQLMTKDPDWAKKMVALLGTQWAQKKGGRYFRWFDSGDLQSPKNYRDIVWIAQQLPDTKFWLPTREYPLILFSLQMPDNLTVRYSATKVWTGQAGTFPMGMSSFSCYSVVVADNDALQMLQNGLSVTVTPCEAYTRGGRCGDCRACWNRNVNLVAYPEH